MSGRARSFAVCLLALATLVSTPVAAVRAARAQAYPAAPPPLAPPGASTPAPRAPTGASWAAYDASRKSEGAAIVLEFFLPGLGSIYADHWQGAATTWGVSLAGVIALAWGASQAAVTYGDETPDTVPLAIVGGVAMIFGARIHGLVDAFRSTSRYNRNLGRRLGLFGGMVLAPVPLQVNGQTALGLGASWQF
jgi:hypothetical protein